MDGSQSKLVENLMDMRVIATLREIVLREKKTLAHTHLAQRLLRLSDLYRGDKISVPVNFAAPKGAMASLIKKRGLVCVESIQPETPKLGPAPLVHEVQTILKETMAKFPRSLQDGFLQEILTLLDVTAPTRPGRYATTL
jgi:hypothetical protein